MTKSYKSSQSLVKQGDNYFCPSFFENYDKHIV